MKKYFSTILLCLFFSSLLLAQQTIRGKVSDAANNNLLSGATISVNGATVATTGPDGSFSIDCKYAGSILVTYVGYAPLKKEAVCGEILSVQLTVLGNTLDNVEITATSSQNKSLLYQPSSITKLSETELKRGNGLFMDDAINGNVPGVSMNRRGVSSGQQINIRGYGNGSRGTRGISSNFDGQGYKVYLNGIPVTDAEGITVLDDIDFGSIGNVEVVKGPAGTLYGLAIAGVINLETIKPEIGTSVGQDVMLGNYGLQRYTTHFQTATEKSSILVNYGHQQSEGFTIHNNSKKDFVNVTGQFLPTPRQKVMAYFGYSNSYDERSGELTISQYESNDFSGNIRYIRNDAHSQVYSVRAGLGHTYTFSNKISNTTTIFGTSFNSNASSAGGWTDKASTNFGLRSTFDTRFALGTNTLSGITGVETQRQNATSLGYSMIKNPADTASTWAYGNPYYYVIGATNSNVYTSTATTSVFTEWNLVLPQDFSVTAGIGISNMKITLDDRIYAAGKPTHYDTIYKDMVSPHVAINKVFNKHFSAYASYSKGYKAPVSSYFYIPFSSALGPNSGIINSKLKPEMGNQFEIGTKGSLLKSKLIYQLALFNAIFSDKMTTIAVPNPNNTATLYSYVVNGGKQDHKGIEAIIKYMAYESGSGFFQSISPFANITYTDYEYKNYIFQTFSGSTITDHDYSGHPVAGVAKFTGNLGVDINTNHGFYANFTYFYKDGVEVTSLGTNTGEEPGVVVNGVTSIPYRTSNYGLLNGKLGYQCRFGKLGLDAFFAVNNITGTKYPIMIFVNQYEDTYIAGPKDANYFAGINLKYHFK